MAGLFSLPTPDAVRANATQQASQRAGLFAQAPRGRAGVAAAAQSGGLFGEALGRAAGGTAPGEKEAIAQQQVQQLVAQQVEQQGLNLSDPNDYVKMTEIAANAFNKLGMTDMAAQAGKEGLAVRKKFEKEAIKEPLKYRSGLLVDPNTFEVVGSGSRDQQTGEVRTEAGEEMKGDLIFVRGDSALTANLKQRAEGKEGALTKPEVKEQTLQRETILENAMQAQDTLGTMSIISQASEHFRGGGTFRQLGAAVQNIVSSIPGFENLDDMNQAEKELFFKQAMQSGINKAIEQKGNLNPQEFNAGLSTAIQKADSAQSIKLANNAFTELARQSERVKVEMDKWRTNPKNKNKSKSDLTGFYDYMAKWTRKHPPIIATGEGDNRKYYYYSKAKDKHESTVNQKIEQLAAKKQQEGEPLSEQEIVALKQKAMRKFDEDWEGLAGASKWR